MIIKISFLDYICYSSMIKIYLMINPFEITKCSFDIIIIIMTMYVNSTNQILESQNDDDVGLDKKMFASNEKCDYEGIVKALKPFGRYQLKIYIFAGVVWFLTGILKTIFEINYKKPCGLSAVDCGQFMGLFIFCLLAIRFGRHKILVVLGIIMLIGSTITLLFQNYDAGRSIGLFFLGISQYSSLSMYIGLISQYLPFKRISLIIALYLLIFEIGKLFGVFLSSKLSSPSNESLILESPSLFLFLPVSIIKIVISIFITQSPRYLLDNDIIQAQRVILKIKKQNQCEDEKAVLPLQNNTMGDSFIWHRMNIKKYYWGTFFKYHSLILPTYCLIVSFFFLGILGRFPNFILRLQPDFDERFTQELQVVWIGGFQIVGLFGALIALIGVRRKSMIAILAIITTLTSISVYVIHVENFLSTPLLFDLAFLGINASVCISIYCFLLANTVQFYPHTVRTIAIGIVVGLYYLGEFTQNVLRSFFSNEQTISLQYYFQSALMMAIHSIGLQQTFKRGFSYQIKQIQEEQTQF